MRWYRSLKLIFDGRNELSKLTPFQRLEIIGAEALRSCGVLIGEMYNTQISNFVNFRKKLGIRLR